jgi:hypothetical protein
MLSESNLTSTAGLLKALEFNIIENKKSQRELKDLALINVGLPKNINTYPYLTIFPTKETIRRTYTGGISDVIRTFRFSVTSYTNNAKTSIGQSSGIVNNLKNLFEKKRSSYFWKIKSLNTGETIISDVAIKDIVSSNPINLKDNFFITTYIDIDFLTHSKINSISNFHPSELTETNPKELTKITNDILEKYKDSVLNEVKMFRYGIIEPLNNSKFPLVSTVMGNSNITQELSSVDTYKANLTILLFNETFSFQYSIYQNLDIIDKIRSVIYGNRYFLNKCYDYKIGDITYNIHEWNGQMLYVSQLDIETKSYEKLG